MIKLNKGTIRKIIMIVVIILCDLTFLQWELLFCNYNNCIIECINHVDSFNYGLTQEDLDKLDIPDYKIFDYLDLDSTSKSAKYYNTKLCKVYAGFACENFPKDKIDNLIEYSNLYFYEKFGPEIYQFRSDYSYGYTYNDMFSSKYQYDDDRYYGSVRVYPTQRRVFMSNLYLKFEAGINYYFENKTLYISLGYSILNEIAF